VEHYKKHLLNSDAPPPTPYEHVENRITGRYIILQFSVKSAATKGVTNVSSPWKFRLRHSFPISHFCLFIIQIYTPYLIAQLHCRMFPVISSSNRRSREMPFASRVFLRHLVGELGTPNLRKFSPVGDVYMYTMLLHGASNLDQRCLKMRHYAQGCTFGVWTIPINFWSKTLKTDKNLKTYNFNSATLIITKFLQELSTMSGPSWVVPRLPQQFQDGRWWLYWVS